MDKAVEMIKIITTDFEEGQIFKGKVVSIKEFVSKDVQDEIDLLNDKEAGYKHVK